MLSLLIVGCADDMDFEISNSFLSIDDAIFADQDAVEEVKQLRTRLVQIRDRGIAFGHQDATAYGFHWQHSGFPSDSDVARVTGDFPAVIGFDLGKIERGRVDNINNVRFSLMEDLIVEAHEAGSIVTLSWHSDNPLTGRSSWHIAGQINRLLPGGENHDVLDSYLFRVADFLNGLVDTEGRPVPVIFRPWHEMNGTWFWWGSALIEADEFKELYRSTVDILKNKYDVHNVLYAYSPNCALNTEEYLRFYPGDEWVDVLGVDVYDFMDESYIDIASTSLATIERLGNQKNKPYAFTETGLENIVEPDWWTQKLYPVIQNSGASYSLVWRNDRDVHWYGPYDGHPSEDNFLEFASNEDILLRTDINF